MNEQELRAQLREFFYNHPAGKELLKRWRKRVANMKQQLVSEEDIELIRILQGGVQMFEKVVLPEVGAEEDPK